IIANVWRYPEAVFTTFSKEEKDAIEVVTKGHLTYDLGIFRDAEVVDLPEKSHPFLNGRSWRATRPMWRYSVTASLKAWWIVSRSPEGSRWQRSHNRHRSPPAAGRNARPPGS